MSSQSKLTRRSIIASTAAIPAAAALPIVAALPAGAAESDPVFAMIERLKAAKAANDKARVATDEGRS